MNRGALTIVNKLMKTQRALLIIGVALLMASQPTRGQNTSALVPELNIQGRAASAWFKEAEIENLPGPALRALIDAGPRVIPQLSPLLLESKSPETQAKAAFVISCVAYHHPGSPEAHAAVSMLTTTAQSASIAVRVFSAQALAAIGTSASNAIPVLVRSTKDEDRSVRMCAVDGLGRIGIATPQTVGALNSSMSDPSGDVQVIAVQALYKMGRPATNSVPVLIQLTRNEDVGTRCLAVQILGRVATNSPEAVVALKLALNDESKLFVRPLAREALTRLEAKEE
jgi:HEAT repeat protein